MKSSGMKLWLPLTKGMGTNSDKLLYSVESSKLITSIGPQYSLRYINEFIRVDDFRSLAL